MNKRYILIIKLILLALVSWFIVSYISTNWQNLRKHKFDLNVYYLSLSILFSFGTLLAGALNWRKILIKIYTVDISHYTCLRIYSLAIMGRYIPGKILYLAGKVMLGAEKGLPKSKLSLSVMLELIFTFTCAGCVFLWGMEWYLFLPEFYAGLLRGSGFVIFLSVPFFLVKFKKYILRFFKLEHRSTYHYKNLLECQFSYLFLWLFQGVSIYFIILSLGGQLPVARIFYVIASFAFACSIGVGAFFAPAGIGVRDYILIEMLSLVVSPEISIITSILSRIILTLCEIIMAMGINSRSLFQQKKDG